MLGNIIVILGNLAFGCVMVALNTREKAMR